MHEDFERFQGNVLSDMNLSEGKIIAKVRNHSFQTFTLVHKTQFNILQALNYYALIAL